MNGVLLCAMVVLRCVMVLPMVVLLCMVVPLMLVRLCVVVLLMVVVLRMVLSCDAFTSKVMPPPHQLRQQHQHHWQHH